MNEYLQSIYIKKVFKGNKIAFSFSHEDIRNIIISYTKFSVENRDVHNSIMEHIDNFMDEFLENLDVVVRD